LLDCEGFVTYATRDEVVKAAQDYLGTLAARLEEGGLADLNISVITSVASDPDVADSPDSS